MDLSKYLCQRKDCKAASLPAIRRPRPALERESHFRHRIELSTIGILAPDELSSAARQKINIMQLLWKFHCIKGFSFMDIQSLRERREEILQIAAKHGARKVRVFGSVARGEADAASDLDLLVEMEPGRSLLDMGGISMELQDLLDARVDVVTEKGLRARIRDRVLKEAVAL